MSALLENTRFTVAFGSFSGTGPNYTGQVQNIGSTGYTVNDIVAGDGLYDGTAMYLINSVIVNTPGNIATLDVTYLAGDTPDSPPSASRGQITHLTPGIGLSLITQVGSNTITPEQLAKILTSNFIKIDTAILAGGGGGGYTGFAVSDGTNSTGNVGTGSTLSMIAGALVSVVASGSTITIGLDSSGLPTGEALVPDGAGGFTTAAIPPAITIAAADSGLLSISPNGELSVDDSLVGTATDSTDADLAAFVSANYTGTELQELDFVRTADGLIHVHNGGTTGTTADFWTFSSGGGGSYVGFTASDGTTSTSVVGSNGSLALTGSGGIDATASPTGVDFSISGIAGAPAGTVPTADGAGGTTFAPPVVIDPAWSAYLTLNASGQLGITEQLLSSTTYDSTSADIAAFAAASYTGTEFQEGDFVILTGIPGGPYTYRHNGGGAGDETDFTPTFTEGSTSFDMAADTGTNATIGDGDTVTYAGGAHIDTSIAGNTVTYDVVGPLAEIGALTKPTGPGTYNIEYDQATDTYTYELVQAAGALTTYETPTTVSGAVIPVPGLATTSVIYGIYLDNTALYPSEFSVQTGQITLLGDPAVDSNLLIRFI